MPLHVNMESFSIYCFIWVANLRSNGFTINLIKLSPVIN